MENKGFIVLKLEDEIMDKYKNTNPEEFKKMYNNELADFIKKKDMKNFIQCDRQDYMKISSECIHSVLTGQHVKYAILYTSDEYGTLILYDSLILLLNYLLRKHGEYKASNILGEILENGKIEDLMNAIPELESTPSMISGKNKQEFEKIAKNIKYVTELLEDEEMNIDLLELLKYVQVGMSICGGKYFQMSSIMKIFTTANKMQKDFNEIIMKIFERISENFPEINDLSDIERGCVFELVMLKESEICLNAIENIANLKKKTFINIKEDENEDILSQVRNILKGKNR